MKQYGFTGTQTPGPDAAKLVRHFFYEYNILPDSGITIIVGGCIGMDAIIGRIAHDIGHLVHVVLPWHDYKIDPLYEEYANSVEKMPLYAHLSIGQNYMARNDRMVELSNLGYAGFPKTAIEEVRSGTWATIRRARRKFDIVPIIPVGGV